MLILDPEEADSGPPHVEMSPDHCVKCGAPILVSLAKVSTLRPWRYQCWCGLFIDFTPDYLQ